MKIIHCADIHLDSPMGKLGVAEKKRERKAELIKAFTNMVDYAKNETVKAILIAGDLFDQSKVSAGAKNAVLGAIKDNPAIDFYYIKGNHDKNNFIDEDDDIPKNLHMFTDSWTTYHIGENVYLTGAELNSNNTLSLYPALNLDPAHFNIVSLHGQEAMSAGKKDAEIINIRELKNRGIDYLALGHIHAYKEEKLDGRGKYCYSGCLEARGFDEPGEHGFVVLDINEDGTFVTKRVCNPIRTAYVLGVDISDCMNSPEILDRVKEKLKEEAYPAKDMVKVELTGDTDLDCEMNPDFIETQLRDSFYDFKLKDLTGIRIDYAKYRLDESLKGEFVRTVEAKTGISEEDKAEIIKIGIRALMGEEVE